MKVVDPKDMTSYLEFNILDSGVRFELNKEFRHKLRSSHFQFGFPDSDFGRIVYYRTYSRIMANGQQEDWPDTVIRVINGIFTIRKWWFRLHNLKWKDDEMQLLAIEMGLSMLRMQWLPPGRGMWIMGSDYVYARGGMSLYNCAYVEVTDLAEDSAWVMDALMSGVGVGFGISGNSFKLYSPNKKKSIIHEVKDSREGWVESLKVLIQSYVIPKSPVVEFDYSAIRKEGEPLKGFGGTASGYKPLEELHKRVRIYCDEFNSGLINETRLIADIQNAIGVCVVAGNIRRSAEIAIGNPNDSTFLDLKDYSKYPERETVGWMSNNSVRLSETDHFNDMLPQISERIINNGEPGIFNLINTQKFGRYGDPMHDDATGLNPCISGDTKILCFDKETGQKYVDVVSNLTNKRFLVPSIDKSGYTRIREARAFVTRTDAELLRIHLDDGNYIDVTSNHIMLLRNGDEIEADKLQVGDALVRMSLVKEKYWNFHQPNFSRGKLSKVLMEYKTGKWTEGLVHHKDDDKYNDVFSNFEEMSSDDHYVHHMGGENNPIFKMKRDHKVVKIEKLEGRHIVYDLNVDEFHNFAVVTSQSEDRLDGIFVHNCGEIPLESYETCNLAEVFPTRCKTMDDFMIALKSATMYASTVSLYPTHSQKTNEVLARNRRIGISLSGITEWIATCRTNNCIEWMKSGYKLVRHYNNKLAAEAGVMSSIRVTTVKPSGSISQVVGVPSGMHFPTFSYAVRRINIGKYQPIFPLLVAAGFNYEPLIKGIHSDEFNKDQHKIYEKYHKESLEENHTILCEDSDTYTFEIPLNLGSARPATQVSAWEQFQGLTMMSREWADNAVSCTIYFDRDRESKDINHLLAMNIAQIKSVSMLPHSEAGAYNQMPYEGIDESKYKELCAKLKPIEWSKLRGTDGMQEKFCTNDTCVI